MTYFVTTLVLLLMSIATGIYAFGRFGDPSPTIAFVLFGLFTSLFLMCGAFEFVDYKAHHPRLR